MGQYRSTCLIGGNFFSIRGKLEKNTHVVEANCDHLVEQSFFVNEYLNKWRSFYQALGNEEKSHFCSPFDTVFSKLQHEINGENNILRLDIKVHNFKNQLVNIADGKSSRIRLDALVAEIFTQDAHFAQKYLHKFIPTDGNLEPIRTFLNGPVADAVAHFKVQLLANQNEMEEKIVFDPLRIKVASSDIARQAIEKLERRHAKLVSMVDQYEKYLQAAPRFFQLKVKGGRKYSTAGDASAGLPDYFTPNLEEFRLADSTPVAAPAHLPVNPPKNKLLPHKANGVKRKRVKWNQYAKSEKRSRPVLSPKSINMEEAQNNIAEYFLKGSKKFKGFADFDSLEETLGLSVANLRKALSKRV